MDIQSIIVVIGIAGLALLVAFSLSAIIELPNKLDNITIELRNLNETLEKLDRPKTDFSQIAGTSYGNWTGSFQNQGSSSIRPTQYGE